MKGRTPKEPEVRQRRNKASTHDVLAADDAKGIKTPPLTAKDIGLEKGAVHPLVQRWWRKLWKEPMAPRWLPTDVEGLYMIARLKHDFWSGGAGPTLAGEIRQQERRFGLDVAARRSFDWRIEGAPIEERASHSREEAPADIPEPAEDPRKVLRAVK